MANTSPEADISRHDGQSPKRDSPLPQTRKFYLNYILYMDKRIIDSDGAFVRSKDDPPTEYECLGPMNLLGPIELPFDSISWEDFRMELIDLVVADSPKIHLLDYLIAADISGKLEWCGMVIEDDEDAFTALRIDIKKNFPSFVRRVLRAEPKAAIRVQLKVPDPRYKKSQKWTGRGPKPLGIYPHCNLANPSKKARISGPIRYLDSDETDGSDDGKSKEKKKKQAPAAGSSQSEKRTVAPAVTVEEGTSQDSPKHKKSKKN